MRNKQGALVIQRVCVSCPNVRLHQRWQPHTCCVCAHVCAECVLGVVVDRGYTRDRGGKWHALLRVGDVHLHPGIDQVSFKVLLLCRTPPHTCRPS